MMTNEEIIKRLKGLMVRKEENHWEYFIFFDETVIFEIHGTDPVDCSLQFKDHIPEMKRRIFAEVYN